MTQLYFKQLLLGPMENFVYLMGDQKTHECVVVDPAWDVQKILDITAQDGMKIVGALATHYHPDHIGGNAFGLNIEGLSTLMHLNPCPCHTHQLEAPGVMQVTGLSKSDLRLHESGDLIQVGDIAIELLHTPGHTPGSMCFRLKDSLVSGDTLFLEGCGRVDLPGGNSEQMYETLTQRFSSLPDETILYPGHAYGGEHAPMSEVREHNPMMRIKDLATWKRIRGF